MAERGVSNLVHAFGIARRIYEIEIVTVRGDHMNIKRANEVHRLCQAGLYPFKLKNAGNLRDIGVWVKPKDFGVI